MTTHSRVLAWRIPGTGERGGLLSTGCTESDTTEATQQQQQQQSLFQFTRVILEYIFKGILYYFFSSSYFSSTVSNMMSSKDTLYHSREIKIFIYVFFDLSINYTILMIRIEHFIVYNQYEIQHIITGQSAPLYTKYVLPLNNSQLQKNIVFSLKKSEKVIK